MPQALHSSRQGVPRPAALGMLPRHSSPYSGMLDMHGSTADRTQHRQQLMQCTALLDQGWLSRLAAAQLLQHSKHAGQTNASKTR